MNNQGGATRKGARWIVDQIAVAFESSGAGQAPDAQRLIRLDFDDLIGRTLDEELERLETEEEGID